MSDAPMDLPMVRNNRLRERRIALGLSQAQLAQAVGICLFAYNSLEASRTSPRGHDGTWKSVAVRLAQFHCVEPEELFPTAALAVETVGCDAASPDGADVSLLLSGYQQALLDSGHGDPEALLLAAEMRDQVASAMRDLRPRDAMILRRRFGIGQDNAETLGAIGQDLQVSAVRVRNLETRGLGDLRYRFQTHGRRPVIRGRH
jgi:RNA polymerase primary sigma factor